MGRPVTFADDHLFEPLDGGWGWVVVVAAALIEMTNRSLVSVFGLLFGDTLTAMGHETTAATVIANVLFAICNLSGLITGPAVRRFDYRRVALAGVGLAALGISLTTLATRAWHMVLTYGVITGLGFGLMMPTTFLAVNAYWRRWRGRALGLALTGNNVGHLLLPHLVTLLLHEFGFRGSLLLLAALCLHTAVFALLWHPLGWHSTRKARETELKSLKDSVEKLQSGDEEENNTKMATEPASLWCQVWGWLELDLLRSGRWRSLAAGLSLVYALNANFNVLLPFYLQAATGLSVHHTASCLSARATGDIAYRLLMPSLTDRLRLSSRVVFLAGTLCLSLTRLGVTLVSGLWGLAGLLLLDGFARSACVVTFNILIADASPPGKVAAAVGLVNFLRGIAALVIGPLIGYIRDSTGNYPLCMWLISIFLALAMFWWLAEMIAPTHRCRVWFSPDGTTTTP